VISVQFQHGEAIARRIQDLGDRAPAVVRRGFLRISGEFLLTFKTTRLRGRPGLVRRSGNLTRQFDQRTAVRESGGNTLGEVKTTIGVYDRKTVQYARVHEFGTVGKGGKLPDIVPRKAKFLRFPVRDPGTATRPKARSSKIVSWVSTKKVSIEPRLGFFATWAGFVRNQVPALLDRLAADIVNESVKK
jgi:hypothetical protein